MTAKAYRVGRLAVMEAALRGAKARHRNCAGDRRPCPWQRLARDGPSSLRTVLAVPADPPGAAR
jgi:hypothetical protein